MQNSIRPKMKQSRVELKAGKYVFYSFLIQVIICTSASLYHMLFNAVYHDQLNKFIDYDNFNYVVQFFARIGNWILIFE